MLEDDRHRLRRLDALFAERVLGHTIQPDHRGMTAYDGGPPVVVGESATGDYGCFYGSIPHYTRSLDAVWEGAGGNTPNGLMVKLFRHDDLAFHVNTVGDTCCWRFINAEDGNIVSEGWADIDHPAEALVLACLRAVGVGEEELK